MLPRWRTKAEQRYLARLGEALRGRRMLVTGASSGIGRSFVLQAARAGADLVLVSRRGEELEQVAEECERLGGRASVRTADLASIESCRALAESVLREDGPVDILVNNAGHSIRRAIVDLKAEDMARLVAVNYLGPMTLTLGLLPAMLDRGAGHIVQISTIGVQTGAPNFAGYVAAKAASDHFARTLRLELGGRGIAVTTIQIPLVRTAMLAPTRIYDAFPALGAEQAARRIGWAVVKRPVRVAPRWSTLLEVVHAVAPGLLQWVFTHGHEPFHRVMARRLERMNRRK
ncbi:MAG: SDR family NAD(P)-dependent oxidoreductase [Proteobacteria bacterium]|nr:SDR family NAD(P)-dependent oxidoreductase [Pseudomonadota bacterium]